MLWFIVLPTPAAGPGEREEPVAQGELPEARGAPAELPEERGAPQAAGRHRERPLRAVRHRYHA